MQERKHDNLYITCLQQQSFSKSCQHLFKIERLCMSSAPVFLQAGLNNRFQHMQYSDTILKWNINMAI